MTDRGRQPFKALTSVKVNSVTRAGRYADGNGLYLIVDPTGAKRWVLRVVVQGRRRDIGLGGIKLVTLAEAREKALELRQIARAGGNPLESRRKANDSTPSFAEATKRTFEQYKNAWRNEKHAAQWLNTLSTYASPIIGDLPVDSIDTPHILRVLSPIWLAKPETARRVRQRIRTVLDWAKAAGYRSGENPAAAVSKGLPKQPDRKKHFAALPYRQVPQFLIDLRQDSSSEIAKLAFEFLILTATRTNETLNARWNEIDLDDATWSIPEERMKAKRLHRVPLCARSLQILRRAKLIGCESAYVFPGIRDRPLSNMVFLMIIRRMGLNITAHGFRSAFRDWAAECTNCPRDVCEMALAHTIRSKAEAAYRRGDLIEKRRDLMREWSNYAAIQAESNGRERIDTIIG